MEEALDTVKYCEDIDDIVEAILNYNVNPKEFLEFVKKDPDVKALVPKILKASKIIREKSSNTSVDNNQNNIATDPLPSFKADSNLKVSHESKDDIEKIFDSSVTPEQFELFRRAAWKQDYYFDDFNVELGKMHNSMPEIDAAKAKIRYLLMFIVRIIYDNGTAYVLLKTNRITKLAIMDYDSFRRHHAPSKHPFYKLCSFQERKTTQTLKNGKVVNTTEMIPVEFWCFDELTSKNHYTYFNHNWIPYSPLEVDPTIGTITFNSYLSLKANILSQYNQELIQPILTHIYEVFANSNNEYFTYIISWFAHLVQFPRRFLPFLLIMGPKRCGKSTFILWFIKYVIGLGECGTNVENIDSILSKFNSHISRKLLIHIKELKGSSNDSHKSVYDKMEILKSKITDNTAEMERKFMDKINVDNYAKFIGCANDIPIRLSGDDKERWVVFHCSDKRVSDYNYFTEIKKIMSDEDNVQLAQEAAKHFYTFLLNYKISINVYRDIPITDKYQEIVSISIQQEEQFLNLLKSGDYQIDVPANSYQIYSKDGKEYYLVRKLQLYEFYLEYCRKFNVSFKVPKEIFWQKIKGLVEEHRDRRNGNNIWYYLIPKEWISLFLVIDNISKHAKIKSLLTPVESCDSSSNDTSHHEFSKQVAEYLSF